MTIGVLILLLSTATIFLFSWVEGGALLEAALGGAREGEPSSETKRRRVNSIAVVGVVIVAMVILRAQFGTVLALWLHDEWVARGDLDISLLSTLLQFAYVGAEVAGKLVAIRYMDASRRTVQPAYRLFGGLVPRWLRG